MISWIKKLLFSSPLSVFEMNVEAINALDNELRECSDADLKKKSDELRDRVKNGESLDEVLFFAFALVREVARRTLSQRPFDVQLIGGMILHSGAIAEMSTGEGKTLAAVMPAYLNALTEKGVHIITVNDYLAQRDAVWMGQIYYFLGLSVGCLIHNTAFIYDPAWKIKEAGSELIDKERDTTGSYLVQKEFLRPVSRKEAYNTHILYGTNHEFGFDYLRDNLAVSPDHQVQRGHNFAIIDEVDSILIDEARTPLIISAPDTESSAFYKTFSSVVKRLDRDRDVAIDEKHRSVQITEAGIDHVEKVLNIKDLYSAENSRLVHYLEESLKAEFLFKKDKDYVVKNNEIIIVDQFTGRLMHGRRYSGGLHQAIEAKENVLVQQESRTLAKISIQNYFRLYEKIAGMTGTAQTSAEEFFKVYNLRVVSVPTNRPLLRKDLPDLIYKNDEAKYKAIIEEIRSRNKEGQPILIGTPSIEKNELISSLMRQVGLSHEVLNAKNHEREGEIIAQAGRSGSITVATNMAGRGVDIILGGNPPDVLEAENVRNCGGLHVIGTERHEARRIDNQLRGRAGRQGDAGSSQFFLSLEDDILRIFGGDRIKGLMSALNMPDDMPIESSLVSKSVAQAQARVEGFNFDARKHLLEYDDVLNKQRKAIYEKRQKLLGEGKSPQALQIVDVLWMEHLENMDSLMDSVRLRAYGQREPLLEYRREGSEMFVVLMSRVEEALMMISKEGDKASMNVPILASPSKPALGPEFDNVGRNDPCPCGAKDEDGKPRKYKKCHGA
ncbi:MAG: preprotein translocase subunit SecA [Candidatus Harrisonbacteria bacterium RIFCSPLOWO2_01_FULL_40_28]|uniref:Protein translocase subunit SecA n=1 Tax=Candidatus Harrisonbacteria bacterium RIFCSPLOWO2_01_FULL_40_28 TaxID=1798406 RepID=A0A1G1ZML2_9BACT|nr:MAG: preprotein translocase subunit SecA [Candidatus Harrisonbacteria bacterium RIFCSPLOWO2_01_FULL_40_28]